MKYLIILLLAVLSTTPSCKKSSKTTTYMNTATITGPDLTMTVCSGGYWIAIDGISAPARFNTLPAGSGIDLTTATFPIHVKLNWHHQSGVDPGPCNIIIVDAIVKTD